MGVVSFDDWLKPVNDTNNTFKVCYRCDRTNIFTGKNSFNLPSWTAGNNETAEVLENKNQNIAKERLQRDVPGHPSCSLCEAVTVFPSVFRVSGGTKTQENNINDNDWALRFINCLSCENGYEKVYFGGNPAGTNTVMKTGLTLTDADTTSLKNEKFPGSTDTYIFEYRFERTECRKCQELIKWNDRVLSMFNTTAITGSQTDETTNRYKLVRRCERTADKTNRYFIT